MHRRTFLAGASASIGALLSGCRPLEYDGLALPPHPDLAADQQRKGRPALYRGPNVILIRFGGGVRRQEVIDPSGATWCPFIAQELPSQGVLFSNLEIAAAPGIVTSHVEGTLHLLTGRYDPYPLTPDQGPALFVEPKAPTLFDYLRRQYHVPEHQTLVINGEDRSTEFSYFRGNHTHAGMRHRAPVLSRARFKIAILRQSLDQARQAGREEPEKEKRLHELETRNPCPTDGKPANAELDRFWMNWVRSHGKPGKRMPAGDRLLTALALRSLKLLRPKLLMINYQDPDEVHWGNADRYREALRAIDEGVRELYYAVQADDEYRQRTVFVVVPDCGRDNNRLMPVPFQHHFNSKSAHEIFAVVAGPEKWVPRAKQPQAKRLHQIGVTRTVGNLMGFPTPLAAGDALL